MEKTTVHQLRGLHHLVSDAVDTVLDRTEQMHRAIVRRPFSVLERIAPISVPVRTVESAEAAITGSVYWSIRFAARISRAAVSQVLRQLDATAVYEDAPDER